MGHGRWGRDFVFDPRDGRFSPIISLFPLNCEVEQCGGKNITGEAVSRCKRAVQALPIFTGRRQHEEK